MREANKLNAKYVLFIGGDEYKEGLMNLKNMTTGLEEKIQIDSIREPALTSGRFVAKLKQ